MALQGHIQKRKKTCVREVGYFNNHPMLRTIRINYLTVGVTLSILVHAFLVLGIAYAIAKITAGRPTGLASSGPEPFVFLILEDSLSPFKEHEPSRVQASADGNSATSVNESEIKSQAAKSPVNVTRPKPAERKDWHAPSPQEITKPGAIVAPSPKSQNANAMGEPGREKNSLSFPSGSSYVDNGARAPMAVHFVEPEYPRESRKRHEEGRVTLRVIIDATGSKQSLSVERSSGFARLDDAAILALKESRFIPDSLEPHPVTSSRKVSYLFKLQ